VNALNDRRRNDDIADPQPLRLLVVEDDPGYCAYVAMLTRRLGFAVDTAGDAEGALDAVAGGAYDVLLIDYQMPRMSGIDLIARLRAGDATKGLYAIMLTGHEDQATKLTALDAGFDDFVTKSTAEVEIVAKLSAARRVAARQRTMNVTIRELYGLATRDELTGLFNRRFFTADVERMLAKRTLVGIILFDVDDFKQVNDTCGHLAGDRVLRDVGALFHRNTRPDDVVARFGGDEFVMAVPRLRAAGLEKIARRLSRDVGALRWDHKDASFGVQVSTGIASSHLLVQPSLASLLDAADRDLLRNKWDRKHPEGRPRGRAGQRRGGEELRERV
jgi:two-component system, cell cycle response regulator